MRQRYQTGARLEIRVNRAGGDGAARGFLDYVSSRLALNQRRALRLFKLGAVQFNGVVVDAAAAAPLNAGDVFTIIIPEHWLPYLEPQSLPLPILYQDEFLLAVNKPSGLITHPARGHLYGQTAQNGVLYYCRDADGADAMVAAPHRLDRDTSGVLVFSKTRTAYVALCALWQQRAVEKIYWAVTEGAPEWDELTVEAPVGVDPEERRRSAVVPLAAGGKTAVTRFRVLKRGVIVAGGAAPERVWALVAASPLTGRSHQIRVHLQHGGYPLIGDRDYNPGGEIYFPRQALHALSVRFKHPFTGVELLITAPLPGDVENFLAANAV
jgi:23S rRNA pseudouridine1911/1915/1917 synthase